MVDGGSIVDSVLVLETHLEESAGTRSRTLISGVDPLRPVGGVTVRVLRVC